MRLLPWYIVVACVLVAVQSVVIGLLLVQRTRRRYVEDALRASEAHFRSMADTAPVMIWRSGIDKRCDFFNLPWLTFTGRSLEQELGNGWAEGVHPDDLKACIKRYETAFDAREPFRMEYRLRRSDGEYRWVLDAGIPRWDSDGRFAGYIGSCIDITDRKQSELALQEAHAELSRVSRLAALGEFAASLAHEIRQPLTAIMVNASGCLQELADPAPDLDDVRDGLLDVVDAGHRAKEVIERNGELFGHQKVQTTPLDINGVIREAIVVAATRLTEAHVTLDTALADDLPIVSGDRIELQQVLLNLIANAIDALEHVEVGMRRIQVSSSLENDQSVRVAVTDSGVGLGNVDLERMFTSFYTTKPGGTGVRLSISRSIVDAHGGRLWAEPNHGRGATFCFTVPVRAAVAAT